MAERFDPYYKWLGIPPRDQPPSHYRLLGLEVFESDADVIDRAANRLMDYLQGISDGEHLAHAQALLNEIAAARLCLLNDEQKASYDKRLRAEATSKRRAGELDGTEGESKRSQTPAPAPPATALDLPPVPPPVQRSGDGHGHPGRKKKLSAPAMIGVAVGVTVLSGLAVYVALLLKGEPQKAAVPSKSGPLADASGQKETNASPVRDGAGVPEPTKVPERAKTDDSPPFGFDPNKTPNPTTPTLTKEEPAAKPRPETATLFDLAHEAVKKKDVKAAIAILKRYVLEPDADLQKAALWLDDLEIASSDEAVLTFLKDLSDAELLEFERGRRSYRNPDAPELEEIVTDALRRNLPEAKRRRGMAADGKSKEKTPAASTAAGSDPKTPAPQPAPDPAAKPTEFLTSQGLTKRGSQWQLDEDAALAAIAGLTDLPRKYTLTENKTADALKSLNKTRAEFKAKQRQADEAASRNKKPPPKVVQFINEWGPRVGDALALGNNPDLRALLTGRIEARNKLLLAVLEARKAADPVDEKYRALDADPRVETALARLPSQKVGPSSRFTQAVAKLREAEKLVLTDETPLYLSGQNTLLSVLIGGVPVDVAYVARNQNFNVISEELLSKLGMTVDPGASKVVITVGVGGDKRDIVGRSTTIPSIRLGNHVLKDLEFLVVGPDGAAMGTGLEPRAFAGFRIEPDYDNFVFKIRRQDAPEPKAEQKPAPAKGAPGKAAPTK